MSAPETTFADRGLRAFLDDVRMRAADMLTRYICEDERRIAGLDEAPDPADVHEDVRESLSAFFEEIRERIEGPLCTSDVRIGRNIYARCDLVEGHRDHGVRCHPCVGEPWNGGGLHGVD